MKGRKLKERKGKRKMVPQLPDLQPKPTNCDFFGVKSSKELSLVWIVQRYKLVSERNQELNEENNEGQINV